MTRHKTSQSDTPLILLACPACAGKVSPAALACPHCGHPMQQPARADQPTQTDDDNLSDRMTAFTETVQKIRRRAALLLTLLLVPALGVSTLISWLTAPSLASFKDGVKLLEMYVVTAPMSLAVALCALVILQRGWRGLEAWVEGGYPALVGSLLAAAFLFALPALLIGLCTETPLVDLRPILQHVWQSEWDGISSLLSKPLLFLTLSVWAYWQGYGAWSFLSAIAIGLFIAWMCHRLSLYPKEIGQSVRAWLRRF